MSKVKALTKEQAVDLLPDEFRPADILPGAKQLIRTPKGLMAFHQSSQLRDGGWKTSHPEEEIRQDVDYVLFAIGYEGILILDRELLLSFFDRNYTSRYANSGYPIHIFKVADKYIWRGRDGNRVDVSECFRGCMAVVTLGGHADARAVRPYLMSGGRRDGGARLRSRAPGRKHVFELFGADPDPLGR